MKMADHSDTAGASVFVDADHGVLYLVFGQQKMELIVHRNAV